MLHRRTTLIASDSGPHYLVAAFNPFAEATWGPNGDTSGRDIETRFWDAEQSRYATVDHLFVIPSPNGRWAAVTPSDAMGIGVAGVDDLARRGQKAVTWLRTAGAFVAWSPDGRTILTQQFGATSDNLALVDATSRAVRAVTLHGAGDLFDRDATVGWQPDGSGLLAVQRVNDIPPTPEPTEPSRLWSFDLDGAATGSRPMPRADKFELSPDGKRVLVMEDNIGYPKNLVYDFASRRPTPLPDDSRAWRWYGDDAVLSTTFDTAGDTLARITAVDGGRVVTVKTIERNAERRYVNLVLTPLSGPPPAGALVL